MPYLIDGHNLIGKMAGLSLSDPDDEARLVQLLQAHFGRLGKKAEVVFDRGLPGGARRWSSGMVDVRFAPSPKTADEVILERLRRMPDAPNWTVVSSDREVMDWARRAGARVRTAEQFARDLSASPAEPDAKRAGLTPDEVDDWEAIFKKRRPGQRTDP